MAPSKQGKTRISIPSKEDLTFNAKPVAQAFSKTLSVASISGCVLVTQYIPKITFTILMTLATFGAVFFLNSPGTTSSSGKKPDSKKKHEPFWKTTISNIGDSMQSFVLFLVCIGLIGLVIFTLFDVLQYNVINGSFFAHSSFAAVLLLCGILLYIYNRSHHYWSKVLPYLNVMIVLFFIVLATLTYNIPEVSMVYQPVSYATRLLAPFLILPCYASISHQYTMISQASEKANSKFCVTLGIIISGIFHWLLGIVTYYFPKILAFVFRFPVPENTETWALIRYLGYSSGYDMAFRLLFALFCLINFLANYDSLRDYFSIFKKKDDGTGIAYQTVVLTLLYYTVVLVLSYFKMVNFYMIALYIPLYVLYSIAFYFGPLVVSTAKMLGWRWTALLMALVLAGMFFLSGFTVYQIVSFVPWVLLRTASVIPI